jgi:BirA family transcriptional regulator, biotin operon repressor / biotin---[acetyl-CoA-carboxylase] ligase
LFTATPIATPVKALLPPIRWPAEAIWQAVEPMLPGFTVEILPEVDSTNTELLRRLRSHHAGGAGRAEPAGPALLVAETQTAGRGRMGRQWLSRRAASLTFSLSLPLRLADWSGLSLAVGVSLNESLSPEQPGALAASPPARIGLKWPNDLWLQDGRSERKLGGILVETATWDGLRYAVIGVGLNIGPADLAQPIAGGGVEPACLQELDAQADAAATLLRVVLPLVRDLQLFAQQGFAPFQARFAERDVLRGRRVDLSGGGSGTACGVAGNGALCVQMAGGVEHVTSSEVSVRPVGPPAC